ncbi:hypothetical protein BSZ37_16485 [Rubrivirga marina]|uniref:Uncharacterized protein n=1 Tax=Rubrivirga marina TaxID=1196024 RepID=A0A271J319_9BACT|nr:hypothetical protein BSZ37_16485 [Rubrivirga marina]
MGETTLHSETARRSPIGFPVLQHADASARRAPDSAPSRGGLALRVLVGRDLAARASLDGLSVSDRARLVWWAIGLTPTARLRKRRFKEALDDGRAAPASVAYARQAS